MRNDDQLLEFLYEALHSESGGVAIRTSHFELTRAQLYKLKKTDPELEAIRLLRSPTSPDNEILLVNVPEKSNGLG